MEAIPGKAYVNDGKAYVNDVPDACVNARDVKERPDNAKQNAMLALGS